MASAMNPAAVQTLVNQMVPKAVWEYGISDPTDRKINVIWPSRVTFRLVPARRSPAG